jgi:hypothetical protein
LNRKLAGALGAIAATATLVVLTPGAAQAASDCATLGDPSGGSAAVCKSWTATGGGYFNGTWSVGVTTSLTYVQKSEDGRVSGASGRGSYTHVKKFRMRACSATTNRCSGWW